MTADATCYEKTMKGVETQTKEYGELSDKMAKVLQNLTQFNRDPTAAAAPTTTKEPKIKKELWPGILTKDTTPIEFRQFLRDYKVYYKESYMDKASLEGQHPPLPTQMSRRRVGRRKNQIMYPPSRGRIKQKISCYQ